MVYKPKLFLKELILFFPTLILGIFTAHRYGAFISQNYVKPVSFSWVDLAIYLVFFVAISFVLFRFKKVAGVALKVFLVLVVFSGSQIIFSAFVPPIFDMLLALLMTTGFIFLRNVLVHNVGIILGLAGVSSIMGLSISPLTGIFILVILSIYDIIAVYWTHHMVHLARGMIQSGAIFGFIIPFEFKDFFSHQSHASETIGEKFMVLGSGDIALPIIMASSLAAISLRESLITGAFAMGGVFLTHLIFINQSQRRPMAALPPIATMTIIGYLVSLL